MCGICGELNFTGAPVRMEDLRRMRDSLEHRGPDDCGEWAGGPVGLAHRRLSILDLSPLGRQPMWSADESHAVSFNGEIYNFKEFRAELERDGIAFRSGSDTEAAVNAVSHWGLEKALARFRGMFALAVWDARERRLFLCRDRVGVKPLYYARTRERLLFGSEMRAILAHPAFVPELNRDSLARYLALGYFPGEETVFAGVRKLPPGCFLRVDARGDMRLERYWSLDTVERGSFTGTYQEAREELSHLMRDAFGMRLVSDVPVGHFLSGGVDSSLVSAVLRKDLGVDITNFTIGFGEKEYNEAEAARAISGHLGIRHEVRYVDAAEARRTLATLCDIYDEPFADASAIPTHILCAFAREHVKVALSADGGDEQFRGYTGHVRYPALYRRFGRIPGPLRRVLAGLARTLPYERLLGSPLFSRMGDKRKPQRAARFEKLLQLMAAKGPGDVLALYARKGFGDREARRLLGLDQTLPKFPEEFMDIDSGRLDDAFMRMDFAHWLPEDVLLKVDRASMHNSLECRDPLLDHRIAEFAFGLPLSYLYDGGGQKRILRDALGTYIPRELADLPKRGFEIPLYAWLRGPWKPMLEEHLSRERLRTTGILDPDLVRTELELFHGRKGRDPMRIWLLLVLQLWADRWLAPKAGPDT